MSQIENLLIYQRKDSELLKIEQEIANSEERKKYAQINGFLKKASEKLDQLEGKSQEMVSLMDKLNKKYEEIAETLKDFAHLDELVEGGADISFYQRNAEQISANLKSLKGEITFLTTAAKKTADEYSALKKEVIAKQKQYPDAKSAYQKLKDEKQAQCDAIRAELSDLAKGIDDEIVRKYQVKRSERIFPIICQIKSDGKTDRCSLCGTDLSVAGKEKAASGKVIECEYCHRFIYK